MSTDLRVQLIDRPSGAPDVLMRLPRALDFHQSKERLLWLERHGFDVRLAMVERDEKIVMTAVLERTGEQWFLWKGPAGAASQQPEVFEAFLASLAGLGPITLVLQPDWVQREALLRTRYAEDGAFSTVLVEATGDTSAMLSRMTSAARRGVKRGIAAGLELVTDPARLADFYPVYAAAMTAASSPDFASLGELQSLLDLPGVHLFLAVLGDQVAAGAVCFEHENALEARYVATHAAHRAIAPLNFVHFKSLEWVRDRGLRFLDLSGLATGPLDSKLANINRFKTGFGGIRHDYPMYRRG